jgi:catechol 2,3-dioxygenase-like lactoylglutathione lyase family enzyme
MIKRLAHVCLHSRNLEETERFYCEGLGLERFFDFEKDGDLFGFYLRAGNGTFIEVFKGEPGQVGNINHIALEVENIDAVIARLQAIGVAVGEKRFGPDKAWQAWLEDPGGVRIELHQYTPDSFQLRGGTVQVDW